MDRGEFQNEFSRLERWFQNERPNNGCINSTNIQASTLCMFSDGLENCYRCTHCQNCINCSNLSHCDSCISCHSCAYLIDSQYCTQSAYLTRCISCSECNYCFGCVGLSKKDFHILNFKYSRKEYFAIIAKLKKELGLPK